MSSKKTDNQIQTDKRVSTPEEQHKDKQKQNYLSKEQRKYKPQEKTQSAKEQKEELLQNSRQSIIKSSQTKLDKKNASVQLPSLYNNSPKITGTFEEEKIKSDKIRRLTHENKKLIEEMKKLNEKLTEIINKQGARSLRKRQPKESADSETAKQLEEAYKQIETYKKMISKQKAKELPMEQMSRITDLQNKIKSTQIQAKSIQKQIQTISQIKTTQQKEITKTESEGPKAKMGKLVQEIQDQKQELKNIRKQALRLEESNRPQHQYLVYLQKLHKELTDEKQKSNKKEQNSKQPTNDPTQQEWKQLTEELNEAKLQNTQFIKKIQALKKHRSKIAGDWEGFDSKWKQKCKQLTITQKKYHDTKLLIITIKHPKTQQRQSQSSLTPHKKSETQFGNIANSEKKKNVQIVGQVQQGAVKVSDYSKFPDKVLRLKMRKLVVWTSQQKQICGIKAQYFMNQDKIVEGHAIGNCKTQSSKTINLQHDEIVDITGTINSKGFITFMKIQLLSGSETEIGKASESQFELIVHNEKLECIAGAYNSNFKVAPICQLKFHFVSNKS